MSGTTPSIGSPWLPGALTARASDVARHLHRVVQVAAERASATVGVAHQTRVEQPGSPRTRRAPLLSTPGFDLAVVAIMRNEARYLEEWLSFHHALGVQHFFLYDNESDDDPRAVLRRFQANGLVTLLDWPGRGRQFDAYLHAVRLFGSACDWMAFIDIDEFIVPKRDPDIPALLARLDGADQVQLPVREFGYSGHWTPPSDLVIASYTMAHRRVPRYGGPDPVRVKSIVRPASVVEVRVHTATTSAGRTVDPAGWRVPEQSEVRTIRPDLFDVAQVNHYYTKSWAEFQHKRRRGSATGRLLRPEVPFDLPGGEEDLSLSRFVAATKASIARVRALDADPYRFGSRLALPVERHDPFAADAALAISNHLAGLPEPSANPANRVPVLRDGRGVVVRADGPALLDQAGLASSVHLGALVQRLKARVLWDASGTANGDRGAGTAPDGRIIVDTGEAGMLRCQAVAFLVTVDGPATLIIAADVQERWASRRVPVTGSTDPVASIPRIGAQEVPARRPRHLEVSLPETGRYLGLVTIDPEPAHVRRIVIELPTQPRRIAIQDLMILTYA